MMIPVKSLPEWWGPVGSAVITFFLFRDIFIRYCPQELKRYLEKCAIGFAGFLDPYIQISIHEYLGNHLRPHEAYAIAEAYLSANSSKDTKKLKAEMRKGNEKKPMVTIDVRGETTDEFDGVVIRWSSVKDPAPQRHMYSVEPDRRHFELKFHKRHKEMITDAYLEHVIETGREIQARNRQRKLYTNGHCMSYWSPIVFEHPATFETVAMDPGKKQAIIDDLLTFSQSKDYYARIGKAWKRGYLLYGPPGTGKSTMIAAMANLLDYDVYDLELTSVKGNTELRRLLTETTSKSIIVIEDIDCSLDLTGQRKNEGEKSAEQEAEKAKKKTSRKEEEESGSKVTLSGLLNFIDGLWSACAGERLIVFTTNHIEKLDPALTRRGRMDMLIELSYCKFEGFKVLAKNYLELQGHPLFHSVKELIEEVEITPADVAENLMPKPAKEGPGAKEGPEQCLLNLVRTLEEAKIRKITECTELKET